MAGGISSVFDSLLQRRAMRRWKQSTDRVTTMDLSSLRAERSRARQLRRQLNLVIHRADARLTLPLIGNTAFQKPLGSDWSYRPALWREQLEVPGAAAVQTNHVLGDETKVFHDCDVSELTVRQIRNTREEDLAPFGLRMEVFQFDGSFLSLVVDLPHEGADGLTKRHVVRMEATIEVEKPLEIFARLNVRHGPNTEQIVRECSFQDNKTMVEFDLAYTNLNEKRVERMWLDIIFELPAMNQVILRDVTLSRRPRAEL